MILTSSANANKFDALAKSVIIMKQAHLSTVSIPIERLIPHPQNPNTHDDRQIKKLRHLIKTHGYSKGSVVYQLSTHHILAGHGLVTALKAEGYTHVDAVELDIDNDKAKAFMIADNKVASDAIIDDVSLQNLINELSEHNVPALDFAFDDTDLSELADRILADSGGYQAEPQDDEIPETVEPITQSGDLWTLGKHRVLCGDSCKAEYVARLMDGKKADVGITDAPYGVRQEEWDDKNNFLDNLTTWFEIYKKYTEFGLLWFCADKMIPFLIDKGNFIRLLIWNKPSGSQYAGSSQNNLWYSFESIMVYDFNGINKNTGTNDFGYSVFDSRTIPEAKEGHPTTKPIDLMCWLIDHYSKANQTILDLFLGSGSTLIAAQKLNRVCYGMEISPAYVDVICARYIKFVGSSAGVFVTRNGEDIEYEGLSR
jgi:DNA modification methylase